MTLHDAKVQAKETGKVVYISDGSWTTVVSYMNGRFYIHSINPEGMMII